MGVGLLELTRINFGKSFILYNTAPHYPQYCKEHNNILSGVFLCMRESLLKNLYSFLDFSGKSLKKIFNLYLILNMQQTFRLLLASYFPFH